MSSDLLDEIEAINSIYSPDPDSPPTLVRGSDPAPGNDGSLVFILTPPPDPGPNPGTPHPAVRTSLRIRFPESYPATARPEILATHSAGEHARKGDASRDLDLFRRAVGAVFRPGEVCLYDALEEFARLVREEQGSEEEAPARTSAQATSPDDAHLRCPPPPDDGEDRRQPSPETVLASPPPWTLSDPVTELRSTFVARAAPVSSPEQAVAYVRHLLATDKRVRQATHNITAWRIRGSADATTATEKITAYQDCDDDGETAAGSRLLHLMQVMDLWGAVVVVTRWYGGQKLGPRRFALINSVARDALVKAGFAVDGEKSGKKKKKR